MTDQRMAAESSGPGQGKGPAGPSWGGAVGATTGTGTAAAREELSYNPDSATNFQKLGFRCLNLRNRSDCPSAWIFHPDVGEEKEAIAENIPNTTCEDTCGKVIFAAF